MLAGLQGLAGATLGNYGADGRLDREICTPGLRDFSTSPTPVIVPPVPTPETKMSTSPAVSRQTSSAVVRRWTSGLAGFLNCCGMK